MTVRKIFSFLICFCLSLIPCFTYASDSGVIFPDTVDVNIVSQDVDNSLTLKSVNVSNERVTANDTNGLKSIMLGLIGDYETVVTDYVYQNTSGYTTHSITIERDWSWILTCCLFIVVIYCVFRAVGGILWK